MRQKVCWQYHGLLERMVHSVSCRSILDAMANASHLRIVCTQLQERTVHAMHIGIFNARILICHTKEVLNPVESDILSAYFGLGDESI